jgi:preprotein translocase subunit SecE
VTTEVRERPAAAATSWVGRSVEWLQSVRSELRKVTWPEKDELVKATRMIVGLSVVLGIVIGIMDWVLNLILVDGVAALTR